LDADAVDRPFTLELLDRGSHDLEWVPGKAALVRPTTAAISGLRVQDGNATEKKPHMPFAREFHRRFRDGFRTLCVPIKIAPLANLAGAFTIARPPAASLRYKTGGRLMNPFTVVLGLFLKGARLFSRWVTEPGVP
jgi:hypothetical protein